MKSIIITLYIMVHVCSLHGQKMDNNKLNEIFINSVDSVNGGNGMWELVIGEVYILCYTDEANNRMRIIAPIIDMSTVTDDEIGDAMEANFHSALDVRYAISENIMWAAFIHPLKELTDHQIIDALAQVYSGAVTFGTTYTSTNLTFPKAESKKKLPEKKY